MPVMLIKFGHEELAFNMEDGNKLVHLLAEAYRYDVRYVEGSTVYYAYPRTGDVQCRFISEETFNLAKLAGKPE